MSDDLEFHYKREERLGMHSAPDVRPQKPGLPGRSRRPFGLLINFVLIAALFIFFARFQGSAHTAEILGWRLTLRGVPAGSDVLAVLEGTAQAAVEARAGEGERLFVVFRAGEADLRLSEALPAEGGSIVVSGRLIAAGNPRSLQAEVSIGGKKATLRRGLDRN